VRARLEMQSRKTVTLSSQLSLVVAAHGVLLYASIAATARTTPAPRSQPVDTVPVVLPGRPPAGGGGGTDGIVLPPRPVLRADAGIDPPPVMMFDGPQRPSDRIVDVGDWLPRGPAAAREGSGGTTGSVRDAHRVDTPPMLLVEVVPVYPASMARLGIEGRVILDFVVDTTGRVHRETVRVVLASNPAFAAAASNAIVEQARFSPGRVGGTPVPTLVRQGVVFKGGSGRYGR